MKLSSTTPLDDSVWHKSNNLETAPNNRLKADGWDSRRFWCCSGLGRLLAARNLVLVSPAAA